MLNIERMQHNVLNYVKSQTNLIPRVVVVYLCIMKCYAIMHNCWSERYVNCLEKFIFEREVGSLYIHVIYNIIIDGGDRCESKQI